MKKIISLMLLALLWVVPACDDGDDDEVAKGSLEVTYDFTGVTLCTEGSGSTQFIYVYVYKTLGLFPYENYLYSASNNTRLYTGEEGAITGTITVSGIPVGDYYVLVFYDAKLASKSIVRKDDPYMLYDNSTGIYSEENPYTVIDNASTVTIETDSTTQINMTYDATYHGGTTGAAFVDQGAWDLIP